MTNPSAGRFHIGLRNPTSNPTFSGGSGDQAQDAGDRGALLGWKLFDGPKQTFGEWKATVQRDAASMLTTGATELGGLRCLLKLAEEHAKGGS